MRRNRGCPCPHLQLAARGVDPAFADPARDQCAVGAEIESVQWVSGTSSGSGVGQWSGTLSKGSVHWVSGSVQWVSGSEQWVKESVQRVSGSAQWVSGSIQQWVKETSCHRVWLVGLCSGSSQPCRSGQWVGRLFEQAAGERSLRADQWVCTGSWPRRSGSVGPVQWVKESARVSGSAQCQGL